MRWHYREHHFLTDPLGHSLALLSLSLSLSLFLSLYLFSSYKWHIPLCASNPPMFLGGEAAFSLVCLKGQLLAEYASKYNGGFLFHSYQCMYGARVF